MEFLDHTGHIFSMPFYSKYPIGYEYETNPYIFWLDSEYTNNLSINTYYIKPIYALFNETDNFDMNDIEITVNSNIYKLIGSKQIQDLLENNKSYKESIELKENKDLKDKLVYTINDFYNKNDLNILKIKKAVFYKGIKKYPVYETEEIHKVYKDTVKDIIYEEEEFNNLNSEYRPILRINNNYYPIFFDKGFINEYEKIIYNGEEWRAYYFIRNNEGVYQRNNISKFNWDMYINDNKISEELVIDKGVQGGIQIYNPVEILNKNVIVKYYIKDNNRINIEEDEIENNSYYEYINHNISEEELNSILEENSNEYEFIYNTVYKNFILIPFYIIGCATEEGTWTSNILIKVASRGGITYKEEHYTYITVGGVFKDNIEELVINGKNMGVYLPKDIIRAIYSNSFYSDTINEELYNEKIKEYLLNFMTIKGEQGNFKSAIASLKWFGWGDKIEISKLLQTDNLLFNQYIRDYFNIKYDVIEAYKLFRNSTYISLSLKENQETDKENKFKFKEDFWGENKPVMENLFDKTIEVKYDEEDITFYRSYYDFVFNEIGLKITALKYYYQKYFLPLHLHIKSASIEHKVYLNDIKHITAAYHIYNEKPCMIQDNNIYIEFPKKKNYILEEISDIIDENFNKFYNTEFKSENNIIDAYSLNTLSVKIPIKFNYKSNLEKERNNIKTRFKEEYFNCILMIKIGDRIIHKKNFSFIQEFKNKDTYYNYFLLCPKYLTKDEFDIEYWINNDITIYLFVNGNHYQYSFKLKEPIFNIEVGKLKYQYNLTDEITPFDQLSSFFSFKSFMWDDYKGDLLPNNNTGNFVLINDIDFNNKILKYKNDFKDDRFNEYYIEEELLNNRNISEKEIINIYERKSFSLNHPNNENIKYLYFYEGNNLYKKYQKIDLFLCQKENNYIFNIENIFEYDFIFHNINKQDFFVFKSYNHFFFEIKYILNDNGEKITPDINMLLNDIDIYKKEENDFIKIEDANEIDENNKYYIKFDINKVDFYYIYYDENNISEKVLVKRNKPIYDYTYNNTVNGFYDFINEIIYNNYDFTEKIEKYIFIKDFNLYTKENKTWYNLLKTSYIKTNIINDNKYLNRIILFDLYKDDLNLYTYNKYESLDKLYEKFFYTEDIYEYYFDGSLIDENNIDNLDLAEKDVNDNNILYIPVNPEEIKDNKYLYYSKNNDEYINLKSNDIIDYSGNTKYYYIINKLLLHKKGSSKLIIYDDYPYDMYLMHDEYQWFCIFISRKTVGDNYFGNNKFYPKEKEISIDGLKLKYVKSSNRFLINRYRFISSEGINHFNQDDIIVCTLSTNNNINFKQDYSSKWEVNPKSIGITNNSKVTSNTNAFIFSIGKNNIYYEKGYYTVKIRYSIDDYIQHQKEKSCIIKIE